MLLLCILLLGAGSVAACNALIDPLWFFPHAHRLNRVQPGFDERAQKTNWLQAHRGQFNAVLFGSSRSTYIDQHDFAPWRMFNHAVNAMWPREYQDYLDHFTAVNNRAPDLVVIGVDFFGSAHNLVGKWREPGTYLQKSGDPAYMLSSLLSVQLLQRSLRITALSLGLVRPLEELDYYDRHNVRHFMKSITSEYRSEEILQDLQEFHSMVYADYSYNEDLPRIWKRLRDTYPQTRFLVFTTPIAEPMFALLVREGRLPDYERWLADLTAAFGEVWDFMGLNSITTDLSQYRDAQHFHPRIGTLIADRLLARPVAQQHGDFGRLVTRANLADHLALTRSQVHCLDPDPIFTAQARLRHATEAPRRAVPDRQGMTVIGECRAADNRGRTA